jgi:hypothetical protein
MSRHSSRRVDPPFVPAVDIAKNTKAPPVGPPVFHLASVPFANEKPDVINAIAADVPDAVTVAKPRSTPFVEMPAASGGVRTALKDLADYKAARNARRAAKAAGTHVRR